MKETWQVQEAKARFSELVKRAATHGPQEVTLHGEPVAVVLSSEDFERFAGGESLVEFMQRSPLRGLDDLDFPRDHSLVRDTEF